MIKILEIDYFSFHQQVLMMLKKQHGQISSVAEQLEYLAKHLPKYDNINIFRF